MQKRGGRWHGHGLSRQADTTTKIRNRLLCSCDGGLPWNFVQQWGAIGRLPSVAGGAGICRQREGTGQAQTRQHQLALAEERREGGHVACPPRRNAVARKAGSKGRLHSTCIATP
ncbi:hypothetical protein L7F22_040348 [Adiantum nelumboides]|nr:hypothetical protein [Adiantum nelumboides]